MSDANNADIPGSELPRAALCVALCQATVKMSYNVLSADAAADTKHAAGQRVPSRKAPGQQAADMCKGVAFPSVPA